MNKILDSYSEHGLLANKKALLQPVDSKNLFRGNFKTLTQKLFRILSNKNNNQMKKIDGVVCNRKSHQMGEIDKVRQLELCVNAARKIEGYDQYD